jgi:hypothetical protein
MNMEHAIAAGVAWAVALVSGVLEAREVKRRKARGDRRKLSHPHLVIARAFVLGPVAMALGGGLTWCAVLWLAYLAACFAPVHRAAFNVGTGEAVTYLGPYIRGPYESRYDGLFWALASYRVETWWTAEGKRHTRHHTLHPAAPFALAVAAETLAAIALAVAIHNA